VCSFKAYLNIFSIPDDPQMTFTSGLVAFSGAATWDVSVLVYANTSDCELSGNVFAAFDDIADAALIGT
jgi:hypothetical protein